MCYLVDHTQQGDWESCRHHSVTVDQPFFQLKTTTDCLLLIVWFELPQTIYDFHMLVMVEVQPLGRIEN